jgi:hypothetical protein
MSETPRRRRFQFTLRTIFVVVTLFGLLSTWAAYQLRWVSQRQAFLDQPHLFAEFNNTPPTTINKRGNSWPVWAPRGLWLLGDRGVVSVWIPPDAYSHENYQEAVRLFPEALILWVDASGNWQTAAPPE